MTKNGFKTKRLPLAAFLHCTRFLEFAGLETCDQITVAFVFDDPQQKAEDLELEFDQGRATVDARAFSSSERFLKNKLHRALRQERD